MYTINKTDGYSLVEVLVAIAILLLALVGPMTIAAKGIQSASYVREQTTAIFLAQEGIEAFNAARNEATLKAFDNGNLSTSWDWADESTGSIPPSCFGSGCNIDYQDETPLNGVVDCSTIENCRLYFDDTNPTDRARYTTDTSNTSTQYRRVITVTTISGGQGIEIESTVYWSTRLFGSQEQNVTLGTTLFNIYE